MSYNHNDKNKRKNTVKNFNFMEKRSRLGQWQQHIYDYNLRYLILSK